MSKIILISGPSGSGKTSLAIELLKKLNNKASILSQDDYYYDISNLSEENRKKTNFDHPDSIDMKRFINDVIKLKNNQSISIPAYNYITNGYDYTNMKNIHSKPFVIIEGIHLFYNENLRKLADKSIFLHIDLDICFIRRLQRDIKERGFTMEKSIEIYISNVKPMYHKYILPMKRYVDMEITYQKQINKKKLIENIYKYIIT